MLGCKATSNIDRHTTTTTRGSIATEGLEKVRKKQRGIEMLRFKPCFGDA